jgi:predicted phage terminase large subunit-like protein
LKWEVVYKRAYNEDGSLFFPEKLTKEYLENQKMTQGSYIFSNQYLNEIIPSDLQTFKKSWFKYYDQIPKNVYTFATVDPASTQTNTSDYTGVCVVSVDTDQNWYVRHAAQYKLNPTQIIEMLFRLHKHYELQGLGFEKVAFQNVILHFLGEKMRERLEFLPITGLQPPTNKTKEMRILSMVPRFEFGKVFLAKGLSDFESQLLSFPRGAHDDIIDAACYTEQLVFYPTPVLNIKAPAPNSPEYERWFIEQLKKGKDPNEQRTEY